jgi:hypothetical protein
MPFDKMNHLLNRNPSLQEFVYQNMIFRFQEFSFDIFASKRHLVCVRWASMRRLAEDVWCSVKDIVSPYRSNNWIMLIKAYPSSNSCFFVIFLEQFFKQILVLIKVEINATLLNVRRVCFWSGVPNKKRFPV